MANIKDLIVAFHKVPNGDDKWEEVLNKVYRTLYDNPHIMAHWSPEDILPFLIKLILIRLEAFHGQSQ